jgi:hypothetical protein
MRSFTLPCTLATFALLVFASIPARAELPQSRIVPPKEDRADPSGRAGHEAEERPALPPAQRAAAHRDARRLRTAGIVFTAVGVTFTSLGSLMLFGPRNRSPGSTGAWDRLFGEALLGIGSVSVVVGVPSLIGGVRESRATAMPTIRIGPTSGALTWSF